MENQTGTVNINSNEDEETSETRQEKVQDGDEFVTWDNQFSRICSVVHTYTAGNVSTCSDLINFMQKHKSSLCFPV